MAQQEQNECCIINVKGTRELCGCTSGDKFEAGEWEENDEKREEKLSKTENICRPVTRVATVIAVVVDDLVVWFVSRLATGISNACIHYCLCLHSRQKTKIVSARQGHTTTTTTTATTNSIIFYPLLSLIAFPFIRFWSFSILNHVMKHVIAVIIELIDFY